MFYGLMFSAIFESFEWTAACGAVGEFSIRQLPKNHTLGTQGFEKHVEGLKGAAAEFCSLFNPFLSWLSSRIPSIGQKVCLSNLAKANRHSHLVFCLRHDLQTTNLKISKSLKESAWSKELAQQVSCCFDPLLVCRTVLNLHLSDLKLFCWPK